jgi:hypothetical protein
MASAANAAYRLAQSAKIHKVEIWICADTTTPYTDIIFNWVNADAHIGGESKGIVNTSLGTAGCSYFSTKPPKNSVGGMWCAGVQGNDVDLFSFFVDNANAVCIMEVDASFELSDNQSAQALENAVAGAVVGTVYMRSLDGLGISTAHTVPVGFNAI